MTERMTAAQFKTRRKKPVDREGPLQIKIVNWLRAALPEGSLVHHCKNEIKRSGQTFAREQAKATLMGSIPGWPDLIILPWANVGAFFMEVKHGKTATSKPQKAVHVAMSRLGYRVAVVRSIDDVRGCLVQWGIGFTEPET